MRIALWDDGEWCDINDLKDNAHRGNNYATFTVANEAEAERISERAQRTPKTRDKTTPIIRVQQPLIVLENEDACDEDENEDVDTTD